VPKRRPDNHRITVIQDDVARVDMGLDPDGDVEFLTLFRDGNRWAPIEAAPTVMPPRAVLAGLLRLGVLGFGAEAVLRICDHLERTAMPTDLPEEFGKLFERLRAAARAAADEGWTRG
jgi:hypothetical protein